MSFPVACCVIISFFVRFFCILNVILTATISLLNAFTRSIDSPFFARNSISEICMIFVRGSPEVRVYSHDLHAKKKPPINKFAIRISLPERAVSCMCRNIIGDIGCCRRAGGSSIL